MKLFSDLDNYVANRSHYALPNSQVDARTCATLTFHSLMAMHVLRQEPSTARLMQEYAIHTLKTESTTNLHEFLHVMHTEILREHSTDQHCAFTKAELESQVRSTFDFLTCMSESKYDIEAQSNRLIQLEVGYKITEGEQRKLRRSVRGWKDASWDNRYSVCTKLWESMHSAQGLLDLRGMLRNYMQEQKWPAPGSHRNAEVTTTGSKLQLINRLPTLSEDQADALKCAQAVKQLESYLNSDDNLTYETISQMTNKVSKDIGISTNDLNDAFQHEHSMAPVDWIKNSEVHAKAQTSDGNLSEAIKGWKNAASDIKKSLRKSSDAKKAAKLVSLKKDGNESKMHDAISSFNTKEDAIAQHKNMVKLNPNKNISHNLYVDGKLVSKLAGGVVSKLSETSTGGATSSGSVASVAAPLGNVSRRPNLFGWVPPSDLDDTEEDGVECDDCHGRGVSYGETCLSCNGTGLQPK